MTKSQYLADCDELKSQVEQVINNIFAFEERANNIGRGGTTEAVSKLTEASMWIQLSKTRIESTSEEEFKKDFEFYISLSK